MWVKWELRPSLLFVNLFEVSMACETRKGWRYYQHLPGIILSNSSEEAQVHDSFFFTREILYRLMTWCRWRLIHTSTAPWCCMSEVQHLPWDEMRAMAYRWVKRFLVGIFPQDGAQGWCSYTQSEMAVDGFFSMHPLFVISVTSEYGCHPAWARRDFSLFQ